MDFCKTGPCKKKLSEYRELTSKLYNEIDSLEDDLKDKDAFLQKVVKARNNLQEDNEKLKKRNVELVKDITDLSEKVDQLDEDTDTGVELLRNANERERKVILELDKYKTIDSDSKEKQSELVKEIDGLQTKLAFVKDRYEKSIRDNQESSDMKELKIKNLEDENDALKEHNDKIEIENEMKESNIPNVEAETKLKEHINTLEIENNHLKQKNKDLDDELIVKKMKIQDIEDSLPLKVSQNSLQDELEELSNLNIFKCEECSFDSSTEKEIKLHQKRTHRIFSTMKADLIKNLDASESKVLEQKVSLSSSLFNLKNEEIKKISNCKSYCRRFCRINHKKYTFVKSKSDDIISQVNNVSEVPNFSQQSEVFGFGAIRKQYSCNKCEEVFPKQGALKKHKKQKHMLREEKMGK